MNLIPGWSSAETLIEHRAQELEKERLFTLLDSLADGSISLSEEIVSSEDFIHCFVRTASAVRLTRRKEKIELYANLLKSAVSPNHEGDVDDFDEIFGVLDEVSYREYQYLLLLRECKKNESYGWQKFKEEMAARYNVTDDLFEGVTVRLERTGLMKAKSEGGYTEDKSEGRTTGLFERLLTMIKTKSEQGR